MNRSILSLLVFILVAFLANAQSVISMPVVQNPLFEVSTNSVEAAMTDEGLILGAGLVITGGSGTYTYYWTDDADTPLGNEATLEVKVGGIYHLLVSDQCDCQQHVVFNISGAGIADINTDAINIAIANGILTIDSPTAVSQVAIIAIDGRMVGIYPAPSRSINLSHLPSGTYLVNVVGADGSILVRKFAI